MESSVLSFTLKDLQLFEMLSTRRVVVVIPAYNEERFIGSVVIKIRSLVDTVIVVDDGSLDETAEIAQAAGALVVRQPINRGKGSALNKGFKKAVELNPDVVVTIDADGQHLPDEMPHVIGPILDGEADLVIGSRYLEDRSDVPAMRVWGHRVFNWITHKTSGTQVTDSQSGYRAFSPKALEVISFSSDGFSVESEMQFIASEHDLIVKEVPITIYYKDAPKRSIWKQGLSVLNGILKLAGQYRPLTYIGLPGALVVLLGFGWGLYVVNLYVIKQELAIGYAMVSVLLTIIGGLALSTGIILHSIRGLLTESFRKRGIQGRN